MGFSPTISTEIGLGLKVCSHHEPKKLLKKPINLSMYIQTFQYPYGILHNVFFPLERQEQQVLKAVITSPSSIRLTWRLIQSSQGYRLEWREGEG